jgi:hypothetical protein
MSEMIVPHSEVKKYINGYAGKILFKEVELKHFTVYYKIFSDEPVKCSSDYCNKNATVLKHERDHDGQNYIAFMCNDCSPDL